ncbi:DUF4260 domain-containing protein [uncultured Chryseobacterium sp.]|uniref:DUF4260 domain-containing protein n=1 Tax=uncultured Chryseobacterium sp. TaxID=259322 RepID=UPI0025D4C222|nr:DUF4260 domain-containing protein [uncultured Chryseobacterium sp.]
MKNLLTLEEIAQFALSIFLFSTLKFSWWIFPICILLPDVSMAGYLFNPKSGARLYNFFHHKMTAVFVLVAGFSLYLPEVELAGIILLGHSSMDRIFGYGLKFSDDFRHTHLGWIGKKS